MKINVYLLAVENVAIAMYESYVRKRKADAEDWYSLTSEYRNIWRDRAADMGAEIKAHYG